MAFWGAEVKHGTPYIHRYNPEMGKPKRLRITEATLVPHIDYWKTASLVSCSVGTHKPIYICALSSNSCQLDLEFEETQDVTFTLKGPRTVHLAGYFLNNDDHISDSKGGQDNEEIKSHHPIEFIPKYNRCNFNQTLSDNMPRPSGVIIEELDIEKDTGVKCDKRFMENNVDASQQQLVEESKTEDEEDKFVLNNAELGEQSDKERANGDHEEDTNCQLVCFKRKIDDVMQDGNSEWSGIWQCDTSMPLTEVGAGNSGELKKKEKDRVKEQLTIPGEGLYNDQTQTMGETNNDMYNEDEISRNIDVGAVGDDQKEMLPNNDKRGEQPCDYLMPSTWIGTGDNETLKKKKKKVIVKGNLMNLEQGIINDQIHSVGDSEGGICKAAEYPRNIIKNAIGHEQEGKLTNDDEGGDQPSEYLIPSTRMDDGDNGMPKKKKKKERVKKKLRILEHGNHKKHAIDGSESGSCKGAEYLRNINKNSIGDEPEEKLPNDERADQINFSLMPSIELGVGDKRNMKKKKRERIRGVIKNPEEAPSNDKNQALCLSKSDICIKDDYPRNKNVDHPCDSSARLDEVMVGDGQKLKKKNRVKKLAVPEGEPINVTGDNKRAVCKEDDYTRRVDTNVDDAIIEDYTKVKEKKIVKKKKIKVHGCEENAITRESTLAFEVDSDFVSEIEDLLRPIRCYGEL